MSRIKELVSYKVGKRINGLIEKYFGGNKSKFGKLLGLDNSGVNKLINGKRSGLTFYQMYQLRSQYKIDLNDMITGEYTDSEIVSEEVERAKYSLAAKKDLYLSETEIKYLKEKIKDKEDIIKSKEQIIQYLKMRINHLMEE